MLKFRGTFRYLLSKFSFCSSITVAENHEIMKVLNSESREQFRNVAIIAHVDHGKTTLVDALLRSSGCSSQYETMDSHQLEQEKGITILYSIRRIYYQIDQSVLGSHIKGTKLILLTRIIKLFLLYVRPGHHDFGGEVERIMSMVDGVCLLVCAVEGPMAQTRFVLQKALRQKLKPIVIVNKSDRPQARLLEVEHEIFDLFCDLNYEENYQLFHCSGRGGWVQVNGEKKGIEHILDAIIEEIPPPKINPVPNFQMLVSQQEHHPYYGKLIIGKINSGEVKLNDSLNVFDSNQKFIQTGKVFKILRRYGMKHLEMVKAVAGDIISIAGFQNASVTHTINQIGQTSVLQSLPIDPPMMQVSIYINNSPFAGKSGDKLTASVIKQRLLDEAETDVALSVKINSKSSDEIATIYGRGDLHLAILIEKMRREGFEMSVTPPQVVTKRDEETKKLLEPMERVTVEVHPDYTSMIIEKLSSRKAIYENCEEISTDRQKLYFTVPTRGLIGFRSEILNETKGTAVIHQEFMGYEEYRGSIQKNQKGALISIVTGKCTSYTLEELQKFGPLFVGNGDEVYPGMIIGENKIGGDLEVNPIRPKKLTNVRTHAADEKIVLIPPKQFTLDQMIAYIRDDELVEVTPKGIRMRKKELDSGDRKRMRRSGKKEEDE